MPDKEIPKNNNATSNPSDVEARIDKMLAISKSEKETSQPTSGVPLLPDDRLPKEVKNQDDVSSVSSKVPAESSIAPSDLKPELNIDDPDTEKAVDDIVSQEADRMLAIEDAKAELLNEGTATIEEGFFTRFRYFLSNPKTKWTLAFLFFGGIIAALSVPTSRYYILNTAGVRASTSMTILDEKSGQPLKNVEVAIGGKSAKTDIQGYAKVENIKLGAQDLVVKKPAYADNIQKKTFGWGSNQLGEVRLIAVGSHYSFLVTDFLSNKPIPKVEATSGEANAIANEKGEISLVVEDKGDSSVVVEIKAPGYRGEKIKMPVGKQDTKNIAMVPSNKHAFVSKRGGTFDLYKVDVDGKNEKMILAGTGNERQESMILLPHQSKEITAFVSSRGQSRGSEGETLSTLNIINLDTDEVTEVTQSERVQLVDFIGDKLVYVMESQTAGIDDADRNKLMSYDVVTKENKELAKANYFNDVLVAQDAVYYTPASYKSNSEVGFIKINADGNNRENIFKKEVFNLYRTNFDNLNLSLGKDWYGYDLTTGQLNKLEGAPAVVKTRIYVADPTNQRSIWVDERDGKGTLILYDHKTKKDKVLVSVGGLSNPVRWLDSSHVIYRIKTNSESADYVLSLDGGEPKKIVDVTDTVGLDRWYLY